MPLLSDNAAFYPALIILLVILAWKGGIRGRLFILFLLVGLLVSDAFLCNTIKKLVARPRPFLTIPDVNVLSGRGLSYGMPSSHAANWFMIVVVTGYFYRRTLKYIIPLALGVSFSRIYNGAHYPSDVIVGACLGLFSGAVVLFGTEAGWRWVGKGWFYDWWKRFPSLLPCSAETPAKEPKRETDGKSHPDYWLRLGYILVVIILAARLLYLFSSKIELSEDEAYQWTWSKHLALSYYSKPPLIAYTQWLGTHIWGDNAFGVRFFSPVIAAILSILMLRFTARHISILGGFWMVLIPLAIPMLAVGATLMTIDPLSVLFWMAAMLTGFTAIQTQSNRAWILTGFWMGMGFLSKYTNLFQIVCWCVFFMLYKPARPRLRQFGPWMAILVLFLCSTPVLLWNSQNGWVTARHVATDGGLYRAWTPTLKYFFEFIGAEFALLNPVFFSGMILASYYYLRTSQRSMLSAYLLSMGTPLFAFYTLYTGYSRVLPNWIAPSIPPMLLLMICYANERWSENRTMFRKFLVVGMVFGLLMTVLLHDTNLISKIIKKPIPAKMDPLRRVRGWTASAEIVDQTRKELEKEGKPVFIIGDHYGITGQLSFYIPEAKKAVSSSSPLVYYRSSAQPDNQFSLWPGYRNRTGQNAIYVQIGPHPREIPAEILQEFERVDYIGMREAQYRGRTMRNLQLFACHHLKNGFP